MNPRILLAAGLALALAGCTLADRRTDPAILPEGPLFGAATLQFEIRAAAGARAVASIDGAEVGDLQVNVPVSLDVSELATGRHVLHVMVFEGPYAVDAGERVFEVERTPPTLGFAPAPGEVVAPGDFVVSLTFSEPVRTTGPDGYGFFLDDQGAVLPTTFAADPDGLHATATLGIPLWSRTGVRLVLSVRDRAGSVLDLTGLPPLRWSAPRTPVEIALPAFAGDALPVGLSLPAGWTGPGGPLTVALCPTDPTNLTQLAPYCATTQVAAAAAGATFDTAALPTSDRWVSAQLPGYRPSLPQRTRLHPAAVLTITPQRTLTNRAVDVSFAATGELPGQLELLAGDELVGTLSPAPGATAAAATFTWPAAVPDGTYVLHARGPSAWRLDGFRAEVTVDRTPPVVTITAAEEFDAFQGQLIRLDASEPVGGTVVRLVGGQPVRTEEFLQTTFAFLSGISSDAVGWVDATFAVDVGGLRDAAGNFASGTFPAGSLPVWLAPGGRDALQAAGAALVAKEAVAAPAGQFQPASDLQVALVDSADRLLAGPLSAFPVAPLSAEGAVASGLLGDLIWREEAAGAVAIARAEYRFGEPLPARLAPIAAAPGASVALLAADGLGALAWTEPDGAGGRAVRFAAHGSGIVPTGAGVPGTVLAAVDTCCFVRGAETFRLLAWLDGASGVPQLALSASLHEPHGFGEGPWTAMVPSLNADPAQAAADPSVAGTWVAWSEAGAIRAGRIDDAGTGFTRADPVSAGARWPRLLPGSDPAAPLLLFVEPGGGGDVIAVRRWVAGTGWVAVPSANAGVAGEVRTLSVSARNVTWTDAAGHVYARRLNR